MPSTTPTCPKITENDPGKTPRSNDASWPNLSVTFQAKLLHVGLAFRPSFSHVGINFA